MKNKILALAFFACSFAFIAQEGVAVQCACDNGPNTLQKNCEGAGGQYITFPNGQGHTLKNGECQFHCHCPAGQHCEGFNDFMGKPGTCKPGVPLIPLK